MTVIKVLRSIGFAGITLSLCAASGCSSAVTGPTPASIVPAVIKVSLAGRITRADGTPLAGVTTTAGIVASSVNVVKSAITDADGRYALTNIELLSTNQLMFSVSAAGYATYAEMLTPTSSAEFARDVKLTAYARVPVQGSVASALQTNDPPTYVGEPYDSAYLWQSQSFYFEAPADSDLDVALSWSLLGNAKLVMAAADANGNWNQDGLQRIRIPRGSTGKLFVGQAYDGGKLGQPVGFTITATPLR